MINKYVKKIRSMEDKELTEERRRVVDEITTRLTGDFRIDAINSEILRREKIRKEFFGELFDERGD